MLEDTVGILKRLVAQRVAVRIRLVGPGRAIVRAKAIPSSSSNPEKRPSRSSGPWNSGLIRVAALVKCTTYSSWCRLLSMMYFIMPP